MRARDRELRQAFGVRLGGIVLIAILARLGYWFAVGSRLALGLDATWYRLVGELVATGHGFSDPRTFFATGVAVPTAAFPPGYPGILAAVFRVFGTSDVVVVALGCACGAATVLLTGLLGRRLFGPNAGPGVGLVAALVVALWPAQISTDLSRMAESVEVPVVLALVLVAARVHDRARATGRAPVRLAAVLGVVAGLGTLVRGEVALIALLLVLTTVHAGRAHLPVAARLRVAGVAGAALLLVVTPWLVRNERALGTATLATTSGATVLAGANCPPVTAGANWGSWDASCLDEARRPADEVEWSDQLVDRALDHIRANPVASAVTVGARELRVWGVWDPRQSAAFAADETRSARWELLAWSLSIPALLLAGAGWARRRPGTVGPGRRLAACVAVSVGVIAAVTYGNPRFRAPVEPFVCLFAVAWILDRRRRVRGPRPLAAGDGLPAPQGPAPAPAQEPDPVAPTR